LENYDNLTKSQNEKIEKLCTKNELLIKSNLEIWSKYREVLLENKTLLETYKKEREEICNYLIGTSVKLPENTTENKYFVKDEEELSVQIEKNLDINTIKK